MTNDNLAPLPCEAHPDFPGGDDLGLLMSVRNHIRNSMPSMGLKESGCGVGVNGADITYRLGERTLQVTIAII